MKDLRELFYNTRKHSKKWEHYFQIYEKHFRPYVGKNPNILEVGVAHGGSTEMYQQYFENANFYCIDYDLQFEHVLDDLGIKLTMGDQESQEFWDSYLVDKPDFDIIIDDGGHTMQQQIVTLLKTYPKLKVGGTYLVEDTHTSYWRDWGGGFRKPETFVEMTKAMIDLLYTPFIVNQTPPKDLTDILQDLWSITYYNSIIVFEKRKSLPSIEANNGKPQ